MEKSKMTFIIYGFLLFVLSLLNGFAIRYCTNPEMGLSAHTTAIQSSLVLIALGLIWKYVRCSPAGLKAGMWMSMYGLYATWVGLLLSGWWGTHSMIAGAEFHGTPSQELVVGLLTLTGGISVMIASVIILLGLFSGWKQRTHEKDEAIHG